MKLVIDSREHSELTDFVIEECNSLNIQHEKQWLEVGDYIFNDVCFEAKSTFDFLQSIMNKRLWNQLDNMDREFQNNVVILYGTFSDAFNRYKEHAKFGGPIKTQWTMLKRKFDGAIGRIILDLDASILWVNDAKTAARMIAVVAKMQPIDRNVYVPRMIKKKISTDDLRIDVLMGIKGISEKKAKSLIKKFGSLMEIGEATVDEISEIKGFGKTLASRLIEVLNSEEKIEV